MATEVNSVRLYRAMNLNILKLVTRAHLPSLPTTDMTSEPLAVVGPTKSLLDQGRHAADVGCLGRERTGHTGLGIRQGQTSVSGL